MQPAYRTGVRRPLGPLAWHWPRVPLELVAVAIAAPFFGLVYLAHTRHGVPIGYLTQDPTTVGNVASYAGFLSNAGVMLWTATAAVCLFAGCMLARRPASAEVRLFLLSAGLLTGLLALDDVYRIHETIAPRQLGLPEPAVHALYASLALAFGLRFRARVFRWESRLLLLALGCLALSQIHDALELEVLGPFVVEDGAKFFGIVCWFLYFVHAAWAALRAPG